MPDTEAERRSVVGVARFFRPAAVTPDADKEEVWRFTIGRTFGAELTEPIETDVERRAVPAVGRYWRAPGIIPNADQPRTWVIIAGRSYPLVKQPAITPIYPIDKTWCYSRRGNREIFSCLRRPDESLLALRRPPECPDKYACPQSGCV
jgi:hypothetical protein